jgi:peptidoglycan/xylan/chitin deacetylase (PgdA/CDA1 family)
MMIRRLLILCLTVVVCGFVSGVEMKQNNGNVKSLTAPGVVLTFDDHSVADWVKILPIFKKYGAHVTFFIDHWDTLSSKQIAGLKELQAAGHAIGCHGMRHRRAVTYSREHSMEKYMADEITPAVRLMNDAGFNPTCFAYPCSSNNKETDRALLGIFRHLRTGCGKGDTPLAGLDKIFVPVDEIKASDCLIGTSVQPHSVDDSIIDEVAEAFKRAKENNEILVFYAHDIREKDTPGPHNYITPDALETILESAKASDLRFYTFDDLP